MFYLFYFYLFLIFYVPAVHFYGLLFIIIIYGLLLFMVYYLLLLLFMVYYYLLLFMVYYLLFYKQMNIHTLKLPNKHSYMFRCLCTIFREL